MWKKKLIAFLFFMIAMIAATASATVLDFNISGMDQNGVIYNDQNPAYNYYADQVASAGTRLDWVQRNSANSFAWVTKTSTYAEGDTPNIESYWLSNNMSQWDGGGAFGDLTTATYDNHGATGDGMLIGFKADAGYSVVIESFDMAHFGSDGTANAFITDGTTKVWQSGSTTISGSTHNTFTPNYTGTDSTKVYWIGFETSGTAINYFGADNINFSQVVNSDPTDPDALPASNPRPTNGEEGVSLDTQLRWDTGISPVYGRAIEHHVYIGTDESAVADANTASSEYKGAVTDPGEPSYNDTVTPINWSNFTNPSFSTDYYDARDLLRNTAHYNLEWIEATYNSTGSKYIFTSGGDGIRFPSEVAYSVAALIGSGEYDAVVCGVSLATAKTRVEKLIRGATETHELYDSTPLWGNDWQSALWTGCLGFAADMIWNDLSSTTQQQIKAVVIWEADKFIRYEVPYWNGIGGDTKAEENAWNSMGLNAAIGLMPDHPRALDWKAISSELMISAYSTSSDNTNNSTILDGRAVSDWVNGYNAESDGVVINHDKYAPDYMAAVNINIWSYLTQGLNMAPAPEAGDFNFDLVYAAYQEHNWSYPQYQSPGGTIFTENDYYVYYPEGTDWSDDDYSMYYLCDVEAHLLGLDEGLSIPGSHWMRLRADQMIWMQERHTNRKMFAPGEYDGYAGCETWVAYQIADAFLAFWLDAHDDMPTKTNWLGEPDDPSYTPTLQADTDYFWRIDEVYDTGGGTAESTGTVWSFTTGSGGGGPATDMYVYDITMSPYGPAQGGKYWADAIVWIKDSPGGANVEGATVTGDWSGASSETGVQGVTGSDGKTTIDSAKVKGGGTFTFTVTDVTATGYTYNSSLNNEDYDVVTAP